MSDDLIVSRSKWNRLRAIVGKRTLVMSALSICIALVIAVLEFSFGKSFQLIIESISSQRAQIVFGRPWEIAYLILALGAFGIARTSLVFGLSLVNGLATEWMIHRLRQYTLYQNIFGSRSSGGNQASERTFFQSILVTASAEMIRVVSQAIPNLMVVFGLMAILFFIDAIAATLVLFSIGIIALVTLWLQTWTKAQAKMALAPLTHLNLAMERVSSNWLYVKATGMSRQEYHDLSILNLKISSYSLRTALLRALAANAPHALGILLVVGLLVLLNSQQESTQRFTFITQFYILLRMVQLLAVLANQSGELARFFPYAQKMLAWLGEYNPDWRRSHGQTHSRLSVGDLFRRHLTARIDERNQRPFKQKVPFEPPPAIHFANVDFAYDENEALFKSLNLTIDPGQHLGIRGPSGSGKSTFLALLLGVLKPSQGKVCIDGQDPRDLIEQSKLTVGFVGAEPYLVPGSLRENLNYGQEFDYNDEDYQHVLQQVRLWDRICKDPQGLEAEVGMQGLSLSSGEKQRLMLARALLRKPQLLILDEPTANLDDKSEAKLALVVAGLKGICTCLIVSHRPGALSHVDRIWDLSVQEEQGSGIGRRAI